MVRSMRMYRILLKVVLIDIIIYHVSNVMIQVRVSQLVAVVFLCSCSLSRQYCANACGCGRSSTHTEAFMYGYASHGIES